MKISLDEHGFKFVSGYENKIPECVSLWKLQTININRAVCVVVLEALPVDMSAYLQILRTKVAFKVGFFPLFWGLGLQVVVICPGITNANLKPTDYVAAVDNQWAIIQSVFFVDPIKNEYAQGRTWGQVVTGKYQDSISRQIRESHTEVSI